jgi:hypothetical protein
MQNFLIWSQVSSCFQESYCFWIHIISIISMDILIVLSKINMKEFFLKKQYLLRFIYLSQFSWCPGKIYTFIWTNFKVCSLFFTALELAQTVCYRYEAAVICVVSLNESVTGECSIQIWLISDANSMSFLRQVKEVAAVKDALLPAQYTQFNLVCVLAFHGNCDCFISHIYSWLPALLLRSHPGL